MRELKEINNDIQAIDGKMDVLRAQRNVLADERRERMFADFCEKYGVKRGDIVHTERYGDMMVCGIDTRWDDWIQVRKIKKNGEPYNMVSTQSQSVFAGCKVIRHKEEADK